MHNLVPHFILSQHAQGQTSGSFDAATLFVDISGFTTITETLMQHGTEGAETLANLMRSVFTPLIATVYEYGGFVVGFAGDAFTAVFTYGTWSKAQGLQSKNERVLSCAVSFFDMEFIQFPEHLR